MKKLRLGIIGVCRRGTLPDHCHKKDEGVEIVAGADITQRALDSFKERYKEKFDSEVNGYLDYKEMIEKEDLDGIFITSPDYCHEEQAIYVLNKKIPVYLEKPMALTVEGCDKVMQAAKDNDTKLMLGHNMRYMKFTNKMKEIIESGAIGEVKAIWCRHFISYGGDAYFHDWHADRTKSNGLLLQKGAHDIDIIHWLANSYSTKVTGMGNLTVYNTLPKREPNDPTPPEVEFNKDHWPPLDQKDMHPVVDVEDHSMIMMQLANGIQASYMQCHYTPDSSRNYTIIGTNGRIENYGDCAEHGSKPMVHVWTNRTDSFNLEGDQSYFVGVDEDDESGHGGADPLIIQGFIDHIRGVKTPTTSPQAARYSVAAGCAGTESIRNGGIPVDVAPLDESLDSYNY